jgi:hypothetical protein
MNGDMNNPDAYNQYMQEYARSQASFSDQGAYMQAYQQGADDYMQQEDEWEREGLLDPLWEKQQRKVTSNFYSQFSFELEKFVTSGHRHL